MSDGKCKCASCDRPVHRSGYCGPHYARLQRHGDPMGGGTFMGSPQAFITDLLKSPRHTCVIWPFATSRGYAYVSWNGKYVSASRLICRLAHGNPDDESMQAAHKCGKGKEGCVNPLCLYWATKAQNEADKIEHGTLPRGERSPLSKLSDKEAEEVRQDKRPGKLVAKEYGISEAQVSRIRSGKSRAGQQKGNS